MKTGIHFLYLAQFFLERGKFQIKVTEKIKLHFTINNYYSFFFFENSAVFETGG